MANIQRNVIILVDETNWDDFLESIKAIAIKENIWKYMDPGVFTKEVPVLDYNEPTKPKPSEFYVSILVPAVSDIAVTIRPARYSDLNENEREAMRQEIGDYNYQKKLWDNQRLALGGMRKHIYSTIDRNN